MLFTSISPEAFDHKNISKDIHEINDHIKNLLVNEPPSHEIPFDLFHYIRIHGVGLLSFPPYSDRAAHMQIGLRAHKVMIRIINHSSPDFISMHIHGGGHCIGAADMQDQSL